CRKMRPAWSDSECGGSEASTGGQSTKPTRHLEIRGPGKIGFAGYGRQPAGGMEPALAREWCLVEPPSSKVPRAMRVSTGYPGWSKRTMLLEGPEACFGVGAE